MAKSDYLKANDIAFNDQQQLFKGAIGSYAAGLGITPAQVTAQAADADYYAYILQFQAVMQNAAQQWTAWKAIMRTGGRIPPSGAPIAPVLPAAVPAVDPGIETRFRALAKQIKAHPNYNEATGEALGIEGEVKAGPDFATVAPDIQAKVVGTQVHIFWGWGGNVAFLDLCELQVDRTGSGNNYELLAYDTTPNYIDTHPFPATPTKWIYRAIYRVGDNRVGQWSKPVTVTVGG